MRVGVMGTPFHIGRGVSLGATMRKWDLKMTIGRDDMGTREVLEVPSKIGGLEVIAGPFHRNANRYAKDERYDVIFLGCGCKGRVSRNFILRHRKNPEGRLCLTCTRKLNLKKGSFNPNTDKPKEKVICESLTIDQAHALMSKGMGG